MGILADVYVEAPNFDTLKFVRPLREDDTFTPQQAERLADALTRGMRP